MSKSNCVPTPGDYLKMFLSRLLGKVFPKRCKPPILRNTDRKA